MDKDDIRTGMYVTIILLIIFLAMLAHDFYPKYHMYSEKLEYVVVEKHQKRNRIGQGMYEFLDKLNYIDLGHVADQKSQNKDKKNPEMYDYSVKLNRINLSVSIQNGCTAQQALELLNSYRGRKVYFITNERFYDEIIGLGDEKKRDILYHCHKGASS